MKKYLMIMLGVMLAVGTSQMALAAEHGGKEHGGTHAQEHGGQEHGGSEEVAAAVAAPSNDDIRNTMTAYVTAQAKKSGTFDVEDSESGTTLNLSLVSVHERIGKTGDYYYSCADFQDNNTEVLYDLDIDVADDGGTLSVADVRIHKVGGEARYTYDENDNRIALTDTGSDIGSDLAGEGSPTEGADKIVAEAVTKEHGGKEHGGN